MTETPEPEMEDDTDPGRDYARVAQAIDFIRARASGQPRLSEIANAVNLSEWRLQKLFSRWAGVSPKRFLQCLTVARARERLRQSDDVLSASLDAGLSGPGRLHDLFVTLEAVSPGEFKQGGKALNIRYGFHDTPLGLCGIAATDRGICRLEFLEKGATNPFRERLQEAWPEARREQASDATAAIVERVFLRKSGECASFHTLVRGTNFQVQVWRALLRIPPGRVVSYGRLAEWIGAPRAQRAVGA
ncbi:MAG: helix-turn-helix domain-containing protein, partial [Verrucomicrobia bacterium]|nr:helix-turn-helix domain-containing protein [Verrucomicrobiota bacterium]